ncbi:hypothetical protein BDA99DRAFT_305553 [Phascolomyces articulosus]|uniref:Uncharacterized protein n=1 Tax=Phascolomyces articulosus TaxID=60185 RepID=A0AAD5KIE3_9FUNG|nr:hypothetical protein BDA99DRAFT_305553 [Phascolomyces articulosus]
MTSANNNANSSSASTIVDYYYLARTKDSPSPMLVFPSSSPTPKLACSTPSRKPVSPFDWAKECFLDDQQTAPSSWDHHFDEMERIGRELEQDTLALERLREKANPTPEERCVLTWIQSSLSSSSPTKQSQQSLPASSLCTSVTNTSITAHSPPSSSSAYSTTDMHAQDKQQKSGTSFLAFLNRFKKSLKLQS